MSWTQLCRFGLNQSLRLPILSDVVLLTLDSKPHSFVVSPLQILLPLRMLALMRNTDDEIAACRPDDLTVRPSHARFAAATMRAFVRPAERTGEKKCRHSQKKN